MLTVLARSFKHFVKIKRIPTNGVTERLGALSNRVPKSDVMKMLFPNSLILALDPEKAL